MNVPRTRKDDWMNDLLAQSGYYVSGHATFTQQLGLPIDIIATVRHARLYSSAYPDVFLLVLECPFDPKSGAINFRALRANTTYQELASLLVVLPVLAFQQQRPGYFLVDEGKGPIVMNDTDLQLWFGNIDPAYTQNIGTTKPVNRTANDMFVLWTGTNLTRQCVFNDIDALIPPRNTQPGVLIELKRPKSNLAYWGPYAADTRNYESSAAIARHLGLENRTIAHNMNRTSQVALFLDIRPDSRGRLVSRRAMVEPNDAIAIPLPRHVVARLAHHESGN